MTGNLSHQIEHHLFPDLPSNRYAEVFKVQALFEKYDLNYHTAPMPQQVYSAWHKVVRLSPPNGWLATTNRSNLPEQVKLLWAMSTKGPEDPSRRRGPPAAAGTPAGGCGPPLPPELGGRELDLSTTGASARMTPCASPSTS